MARKTSNSDSTAHLGFEAKLWLAADSRSAAETAEGNRSNNMDAAEYSRAERDRSRDSVTRRASRGLRVKYISDTFEEHRAKLVEGKGDYAGANPEDQDEPNGARQTGKAGPEGERGGANQYKAENVFWVPPAARWSTLQNSAKQPTIGTVVDDAMVAIKRDNPRLKGVLPKEYVRRKVRNQNDEGRKRPEKAHQAVRAANYPLVRKPAEINRGTGSWKTTSSFGKRPWGRTIGKRIADGAKPSSSRNAATRYGNSRNPRIGWSCWSMGKLCQRPSCNRFVQSATSSPLSSSR